MRSVELHTHSAASYDGRDSVEDLLAAASAAGLDAIAITDHDEITASLDAVDRAPAYDLLAIPGVEISSAAGHVLALGVEELIPAGLSFAETVDRIHAAGGIAVVPHPFQEVRSGVLRHISPADVTAADAIEVYNSRLLTGRSNRQARQLALDRDLPMTAGSDAHVASMVGRAVTRVEPPALTVDAILDEIAAGRTAIDGRRTPWRVSVRQAASGIRRRLRNKVHHVYG